MYAQDMASNRVGRGRGGGVSVCRKWQLVGWREGERAGGCIRNLYKDTTRTPQTRPVPVIAVVIASWQMSHSLEGDDLGDKKQRKNTITCGGGVFSAVAPPPEGNEEGKTHTSQDRKQALSQARKKKRIRGSRSSLQQLHRYRFYPLVGLVL